MVQTTTPTVQVSAGRIGYTESGSGPPVVMLHGLLMNHTVWDPVMPLLPSGFRYIRPDLPLGAHRIGCRPDADLTMTGMVHLVADFLDALDLRDVTLVHSDWGGGLFLTALGRDERVARLVILPCEAFDNFPPGLPGRMAVLASRVPGGFQLAARQLRIGWLRRTPLLFGWMAAQPIDDAMVRGWTEPILSDPDIARDLATYTGTRFRAAELIRDTEALSGFGGDALVLWSPDNRVMPPDHGHRLAGLIPGARYAEIPGTAVLSMLDDPAAVAREVGGFLRESVT